jgi:glycosyltransferase involved in cell wall biosynthesis
MIRVAALTSGRNMPSSRFRIRQHVSALGKYDVQVTEYCPAVSQHLRIPGKLSMVRTRYLPPVLGTQMLFNIMLRIPGVFGTYKADAVWLERSFLPGLEALVHLTKSPRVLDVDDAVWLTNPLGERSARYLARNIDAVIAGNSYVADWYSNYCSKVYVVPTAIDCQRFVAKQECPNSETGFFVIGWTGTSANFKYLKLIEKPLASFLKHHKQARLLIMADRRPAFALIPESQVMFVPWTIQIESAILHKMDVGIMPLANDEWTRGKCSFKMLQYMATGIPAVVSNVGMNSELLKKGFCGFGATNDEAWYQHIENIFLNPVLRTSLGKVGRKIVEENYSVHVVSKQLAEVFFNLL